MRFTVAIRLSDSLYRLWNVWLEKLGMLEINFEKYVPMSKERQQNRAVKNARLSQTPRNPSRPLRMTGHEIQTVVILKVNCWRVLLVHLCSKHQGGNIFLSMESWACEILINSGAICLLAIYLTHSVTGGQEGPDRLDSHSILTPALGNRKGLTAVAMLGFSFLCGSQKEVSPCDLLLTE